MKMDRFSIAQRVNIVKTYYKNNDSVSNTHRALRKDFGRHGRPVLSTISSVVDKFEHVVVERALHPPKVTVWCALWSGGVIGPYFFKNDEGDTVTVNSERYNQMLTNYFWPAIEDMNLEHMWFQQDGTTCHTTRQNMAELRTKFEGRIISRFGDVSWPSRSCDLSPLDFFLWGYVKDKVYTDNPQTLEHLKDNIREVIATIQPAMCKKVIENYIKRIDVCQAALGGHLNDVIFHH